MHFGVITQFDTSILEERTKKAVNLILIPLVTTFEKKEDSQMQTENLFWWLSR